MSWEDNRTENNFHRGIYICHSSSYFFLFYCKFLNVYHTYIHVTGKFDEPAGLLPLAAVFVYDNDAFNDAKDIGIFPKES